jgi:hypothetical protein
MEARELLATELLRVPVRDRLKAQRLGQPPGHGFPVNGECIDGLDRHLL